MTDSLFLQGTAFNDFYSGNLDAVITVTREDGKQWDTPIRSFFRDYDTLTALEKTAVRLCSGTVLDAGAGAGALSLILQERGLPVVALDIVPAAVDVMRDRGVRDTVCLNIFDFHQKKFDTILMMMNGIGLARDIAGLDTLLAHIRTIIYPDGRLLLDSTDVRFSTDPADKKYHNRKVTQNCYLGEYCFTMTYNNVTGEKFNWLFIDPETLIKYAEKNRWYAQVVYQEGCGAYLAQLIPYD